MKTVAIITEYNPFHNGHQYQIDALRDSFDEQIAIIAIMSGNFTQRGELAVADKLIRAKAAVECGVDLVLELPFPYSMSSAEFFARGGVYIADRLGVVDYLAFGSEIGDIYNLKTVARNMSSAEFSDRLASYISDKKYASLGYPALCERAYCDIFGEHIDNEFFSPNNILAVEYIKAIDHLGSSIEPITIKREGAGYSDLKLENTHLQSATAIRAMMAEDPVSALDYVPDNAKTVYTAAIDDCLMPTDQARLDAAVISFFRLSSPEHSCDIHDGMGGLYNRLCDMSADTDTISSLTSKTETKRYTKARIRRVIWNSYFGVTSSDVCSYPQYTQILAMNGTGRSLLKRIKKMTDFPVITKPSDYDKYSDAVVRQKSLADRADSVFALAHKKTVSGRFSLRLTPYVKK